MSEEDKIDIVAAILAAASFTNSTPTLEQALLFKATKQALQFTGLEAGPYPDSKTLGELRQSFESEKKTTVYVGKRGS